LLRASFIPPLPQRELRDLTRQRTNLVRDRAQVVNQLQKVLEWANIKLASVVSDITGVSARAMLAAIVAGEANEQVLAELARGRLRSKQADLERALEGHMRPHQRFMLAQHLIHIDFLEEQIATFDAQIAAYMAAQGEPPLSPPGEHSSPTTDDPPRADTGGTAVPWAEAVALLDTMPGIGRTLAEQIIAEVGTDMARFPSEGHLSSWAKVCPGNHESAGKRYSSRTGKGSRWLRTALVQGAWAAIKVKESHLAAVYRRLVVRLGAQKAIMAVAHRMLVAIYHMLKDRVPYRERGAAPQSEPARRKLAQRMQRKIEDLGFKVTLQSAPPIGS
jgi:transposase